MAANLTVTRLNLSISELITRPKNFRKAAPGSNAMLQRRISVLKWAAPVALALLVIAYEIGPAMWLYQRQGLTLHIVADLLLFATVGPILAFVLLHFLGRWLEERESREVLSQILAHVREEAEQSRKLSDDALQVLFASGTVIAAIRSSHEELSQETVLQLKDTEKAIDRTIRQLRDNLTN